MTIISLLNLPLTLPPEAEARHSGLETFFSGLPEYISRCKDKSMPRHNDLLTLMI